MGYYAYTSGEIAFKGDAPDEVTKNFLSFLESNFFQVEVVGNRIMEFSDDIKFWEDAWIEELLKTEPYIEHGNVELKGEDFQIWQYDFRDGKWYSD